MSVRTGEESQTMRRSKFAAWLVITLPQTHPPCYDLLRENQASVLQLDDCQFSPEKMKLRAVFITPSEIRL